MRIGILSSAESWYFRDLHRAAVARGHEALCIPFAEMSSSITAASERVQTPGHCWSRFESIVVRSMPAGSLEQVVFRMDMLARYEASGGLLLNPARCLEVCIDKYLTTARLASAELPTPATIVCQTWEDALRAFHELGGDVVVKPLFGGEGRGITRISDEEIAVRAFKTLQQLNAVLYLQQFVPHLGYDIRVLVIGEDVFSMRRISDDWRTNVSRGGRVQPHDLSPEHRQMALQAASAVAAPFAGVDLLPTSSGEVYVLEVNAVPGWKALSQLLDLDVAERVIRFLEARSTF